MRQGFLIGLIISSLTFLRGALTAATVSELHARQQCDSLICPDQSWFTNIGDKLQDAWQSVGGYLDLLFLKNPPEQQIPTELTMPLLPGSGEIKPENPYETELLPKFEPFSGKEKCPVGAPELNYDTTDQNPNFRQCEVAPAQIVVPTDCISPKNAMVAQKLALIDPLLKTSRSPRCPGKNGVVFWLAHLTPDQAAMILAESEGAVEGIAPNSPFKSEPLTPAPELMASPEVMPKTTKMGNRLKKKRGILRVESKRWRLGSDPSLTFLSTPPGRINPDIGTYTYFKTAIDYAKQQDIRVYLVDSGYVPGSAQIREDRLEWLYGLGATNEERDNDGNEHGTCIASKIGSPDFGVFPEGPVFTIVKVEPTVASFIDALGSILADVRHKGPAVQGRAVIQITGNWAIMRDEAYIVQVMRDGINSLLSSKVIVVSPAAAGRPGSQRDTWPSLLAGLTNMITVGAIMPAARGNLPYGAKYPWSLDAPLGVITVSAPGGGLCRNTDGRVRSVTGPGLAAAIATGLVAYFLAIPDLQDYFWAQPDWASAVKGYVAAMSYPRHQLTTAVWNGLDSEADTETYNTPSDPWIGIPYAGNPRFG